MCTATTLAGAPFYRYDLIFLEGDNNTCFYKRKRLNKVELIAGNGMDIHVQQMRTAAGPSTASYDWQPLPPYKLCHPINFVQYNLCYV